MLQRIPLRWLAFGITVLAVLCFLALAAANRAVAPVALAAAVVIALKGTIWLYMLRRNRVRLRRHGYHW